MKEALINKTMSNINKYYKYDNVKLNEIRYGLETFYITIFKLIVLFLISFFIHTTKELCLLFLFYGLLRLTGFGLHANKSIICWILSIMIFSVIPFIIKNVTFFPSVLYIVSLILTILIIVYAPADTKKRPLISKKKRLVFKVLSSITAIIYTLMIYFIKIIYYKYLLLFSLLL